MAYSVVELNYRLTRPFSAVDMSANIALVSHGIDPIVESVCVLLVPHDSAKPSLV